MEIPRTTYRLQVRPGFDLHRAAEAVDYFADLGVDTLYLSPLLTSVHGSDHGYDGTDPTTIDQARGGEPGWQALLAATRARDIRLVVDIVPNHLSVAVPAENPSWWSVLAQGQASPYAHWYDIDWTRPITIPVLADDDAVRDLRLVRGEPGSTRATGGGSTGSWELRYHDHRFPVAEGTVTEGAATDGGAATDDPVTVLGRQHYRLIAWRRANDELSHRRFFAVNTLAGVRVEDSDVFDATHARILEWVAADAVIGLRVDHPDGLADPAGYLARLAEACPDRWIVAEKILEPGETLPADWAVAGTTGYDAMTELTAVLIDPHAEAAFTATYTELTGDALGLAEHVRQAKGLVADRLFGAEFGRVAGQLPDQTSRYGETTTIAALRALAVAFEVYRSYLPTGAERLAAAAGEAVRRHPVLAEAITDCADTLAVSGSAASVRFEQLTGPVMAKGLEDTAWYRYSRFVALNEVGGDPGRFGCTPAEFHTAWQRRAAELPHSMISLSTHDTKRGEDVRARLACLSEIPRAWHHYAENFCEAADELGGSTDRSFTYLLAQTIAGIGLGARDRLHAYVEKAMREASVATSWDDPDPVYEGAVHHLVDHAHDDPSLRGVVERLLAIIEQPGWSNALAQKLLALTGPGVPDVYQGTESWEDSLADPDNRRPVDFAALASRLRSLHDPRGDAAGSIPPVDASGDAKLWVTAQALRLRRDHPDRFTRYRPLQADGPATDHLVAFDRGGVIAAATRLPITLSTTDHGWGDTVLTLDGSWNDVLSGRRHERSVRVADLFAALPVALLTRD